ncbi:MAG: helix-turn-helix transcriptional regulator [Actinomycetota bacterium]
MNDPIEVMPVEWNPADGEAPLEVFTRRSLFERVPIERLGRHERLQFHLVQIVTGGVGHHEVDFVDVELRRGSVLVIEPGQVHRWHVTVELETVLVLFPDEPSALLGRWFSRPMLAQLDDERLAAALEVIELIRVEREIVQPTLASTTALAGLRDVLIARLGLLDDDSEVTGDPSVAYRSFRSDLDTYVDVTQTIADRATRLGYSPRTLARACRQATGRTAKQLTDERLLLEARRLLSQPGVSAARAGHQLGFSEATNFSKFFRRLTGERPSEWQRRVISSSPRPLERSR